MSKSLQCNHGSTCVRLPPSNNPVTDVTSTDIRCNVGGTTGVAGKCAVTAGQTVTVEMHQQPGDRSCADEAIGGDHYGPVQVYMSKVSNAATADGSSGWFKVFEDTWANVGAGSTGSTDNWGTKDLNTCCGKMNVKIPSDIPAGDYLLKAEVIALHVASSTGGAQFYTSCFQLTVSGGGSANPGTVLFPGAYSASDPGILINIYQSMSTYIAPGPTLYSGGSTKSAGAACSGAELSTPAASGATSAATSSTLVTTTAKASSTPTQASTSSVATTSAAAPGACSVAKYGQCGGTGYTGCTTCASGSTCSDVSPPYYMQCV
ncbi:MAG: hypothetical protein Q9165_005141 [Trypethelium subeluteriae]